MERARAMCTSPSPFASLARFDQSPILLPPPPIHRRRRPPPDENSFDVLGAESMGQIGYVLAQALSSAGCLTSPIICQVVVDQQHEAFRDPSKFVGPIYGAKEATALGQSLGWIMKPDGEYFRRVVPSPPPVE